MTPRQKALAASSPTLLALLGALVWNAIDRRRQFLQAVQHWTPED